MIKIEDLKKKTYKEVTTELEAALGEYKSKLSEITDVDTLNKEEERLMEEQKAADEYIKGTKYALPDAAMFDDERFTKNAVAKLVVEFLSRAEIDWQYTLGYFQIVKLWKSKDLTEIDYYSFDGTLRMLNNLKFKGYTDWRNILAVNEYMKGCHEPYSIDTAYLVFLSQKHQAIMDRVTLVQKVEPVNE